MKAAFDPLEEHKHWCPWIALTSPVLPSSSSPAPQPNDSVVEDDLQLACIVALKAIAPGLMDNNTGLAQTMKVVRCVMFGFNPSSNPNNFFFQVLFSDLGYFYLNTAVQSKFDSMFYL